MILTFSDNETPYEYHQALIRLITTAKQNFILMGELLYNLKQEDNFKQAVGEGIDTWVDYVKQPEIGLSKGEANRLVQIYEHFVARLGFSPETISEVPIKNLHYLLPIVKGMDNVDDVGAMLADATLLSQQDFKERLHDIQHNEERTYEFIIFRKSIETGSLSRVYDISSEQIISKFNELENYNERP